MISRVPCLYLYHVSYDLNTLFSLLSICSLDTSRIVLVSVSGSAVEDLYIGFVSEIRRICLQFYQNFPDIFNLHQTLLYMLEYTMESGILKLPEKQHEMMAKQLAQHDEAI